MGEEEFIKKLGIFSDLKLRAGYGMAGNNRIGSYASLELLNSISIPTVKITHRDMCPASIPNEYLQWESNNTFNLGIDLGFLEQRLTISPEFYVNQSTHLLLTHVSPVLPVTATWYATSEKHRM